MSRATRPCASCVAWSLFGTRREELATPAREAAAEQMAEAVVGGRRQRAEIDEFERVREPETPRPLAALFVVPEALLAAAS